MKNPFKKLLSELKFKDDAIYYHNERMIIVSAKWLAGIQKETEKVIGADGSSVVISNAVRDSGTEVIKSLLRDFAGLSTDKMVQKYFDLLYWRGWGKVTVIEYREDPFFMLVKYEKSYLKDIISNKEEPQCIYFYSILSVVEEVLKTKGIEKSLELEETQCVATGAPYCLFEFKEVK